MPVGSGELTYITALPSARIEPGQAADPGKIGSQALSPVDGWHWDRRVWVSDDENDQIVSMPANWDPSVSGITEDYFQSGIGSGSDLELEKILEVPGSGLDNIALGKSWAPEVNHGYYYKYSEQGYLFSDDSEIRYATWSGVEPGIYPYVLADGFNIIPITSDPKVGIPIILEQYEWEDSTAKYILANSFKKKTYFSGIRDSEGVRQDTWDADKEAILWDKVDQTLNEFIVTTRGVTPKIILNNQYVTQVDPEDLGYFEGTTTEIFHTLYSPIDRTMGVDVYTYLAPSGIQTNWTAVSQDAVPSGTQVSIDYDLGTLQFLATKPVIGESVVVTYWKTIKAEYEPDWAKDTIIATETNMNPIYRQNSRGFVYLSLEEDDPTRIELSAILPVLAGSTYGPLFIGNAYAPIVAKVYDSQNQLLEDQQVIFNIVTSPQVGSFGTNDASTIAPTNWKGEARVFYRPPRSINEIGEVVPSGDMLIDGDTTRFTVDRLVVNGNLENVYLYQIYTDDPILGLLDPDVLSDETSQIAEHYRQFFEEQEITGGTKTVDWEDAHRSVWNLIRPQVFNSNSNLGRKKIVAFLSASGINPHTFEEGCVLPVQPIATEEAGGSAIDIIYDTSLNTIPTPSGELWGYYIVAPSDVTLQATVFNQRLNQTITSNEIDLRLTIPPYMSGIWILDEINASHIDEISHYLAGLTASGQHVPLGFRLRSSRVTLAAALDGVTFLDINPTSPYLGHRFGIVP